MDIFTFIFLVVVVGCGVGAYAIWEDGRKERLKRSDNAGGLAEEVAALRARVEVLEEIVTDQKYQLSRELESLEARGQGSR